MANNVEETKEINKEANMLRLWQSAVSPADAFYAGMAELIFRTIKAAMIFLLKERFDGRGAHCASVPEKDSVFDDYYKKLAFYYANALRLLGLAGRTGHEKLDNVIAGMTAVIQSRINTRKNSDDRNNPPDETGMIPEKFLQAFSDSFDLASYRPKSALYADMFHETRALFINHEGNPPIEPIHAKACEIVRMRGFSLLYELYAKTLADIVSERYSKEFKPARSTALTQVKNEHEILKNLATVQVSALLHEGGNAPAEVRRVLEEVAMGLKVAQETLQKDIFSMSESLIKLEAEENMSRAAGIRPESFEEFSEKLYLGLTKNCPDSADNAFANKDDSNLFSQRFSAMRQCFVSDLTLEALMLKESLTDESEADPSVFASGAVDSLVSLTREVKDVFSRIYDYYNENVILGPADGADEAEELEGRISAGIAETVHIKTESLEEGAEWLLRTTAPILSGIKDAEEEELPEGDDDFEEKLEAMLPIVFDEMVKELSHFQKEDRRAHSAIKKYLNFSRSNDLYKGITDEIIKPQKKDARQKQIRKLEQIALNFKKEQLLYEISTFEEVLLYSVSRLRESENSFTAGFVALLDTESARIFDILSKYGIEQIRPLPHDNFNGREHEVLMAEVTEGYKKGEIIKVQNSGYKQGGTVLLRANVIAAK